MRISMVILWSAKRYRSRVGHSRRPRRHLVDDPADRKNRCGSAITEPVSTRRIEIWWTRGGH
jgi:hypothetical protein